MCYTSFCYLKNLEKERYNELKDEIDSANQK
jgi:hypothetical protein